MSSIPDTFTLNPAVASTLDHPYFPLDSGLWKASVAEASECVAIPRLISTHHSVTFSPP